MVLGGSRDPARPAVSRRRSDGYPAVHWVLLRGVIMAIGVVYLAITSRNPNAWMRSADDLIEGIALEKTHSLNPG